MADSMSGQVVLPGGGQISTQTGLMPWERSLQPFGSVTADQLFGAGNATGSAAGAAATSALPTAPPAQAPAAAPAAGSPGAGGAPSMDDLSKLYSQSVVGVSDADILKALLPATTQPSTQIPPYFTRQIPQAPPIIQDRSPVV